MVLWWVFRLLESIFIIITQIQKGFKDIESVKNYISKNCEENNRFKSEDGYKELIEFVINKI
jgi:hypothetical protein